MSGYHTQAAFDTRLAARRADPRPPSPVRVFYHISCMNNWQQVVIEQLRLLAHVGLTEATACVLGSEEDACWCKQQGNRFSIALDIPFVSPELGHYEGPTLSTLYQWCQTNLQGCVFYLHTKGVSKPDDNRKAVWRRVMQRHVIGDWRQNVEDLAIHDVLGVGWREEKNWPHFPGNFWAARADWIANLEAPERYRRRHPRMQWAGYDWSKRMYVETWLGSRGYHHVKEKVRYNVGLWDSPELFALPFEVEGFQHVGDAADYSSCRELHIDLGGGRGYGCCDYLNVDKNAEPGKGLQVDFEREPLPFADDSVAAVHSAHCLEHITNLRGLLREIVRVCRVGARIYLRLPHWLHPMAMCHDHKQVIPPEQVKHWTQTELRYWWEGCTKRFAHRGMEMIRSERFEEAKQLFPRLTDEELMDWVPGAAQEVVYLLSVVPHEG